MVVIGQAVTEFTAWKTKSVLCRATPVLSVNVDRTGSDRRVHRVDNSVKDSDQCLVLSVSGGDWTGSDRRVHRVDNRVTMPSESWPECQW